MGHLVRELSTTFLQHTRHQSGEVEVVEGFHAAMFLGSWFDLGAKVWLYYERFRLLLLFLGTVGNSK